ncbi:MAG: class I SAM-dependent methyltransferase [Burkholderiaceae bacterium]
MNRETTNRIRFVLEDLLPPAVRDSRFFLAIAKLAWGGHIEDLSRFRARAPFLTAEEYEEMYRTHPRVHAGTDNSVACISRITADLIGPSICDIGCGTGVLLQHFKTVRSDLGRLTGVDFVVDDAASIVGIEFIAARIESLPFDDCEFDTVVCTHVIEHVLDFRAAIAELRRICRRRLIIVVPAEREYKYTFNPHFNFFPYAYSFLRAMQPVPAAHTCIDIGRDIYYREDRS